jgi:hypothetical protein
MHDKPGIALDLGRVAAIIMDAVTDEDRWQARECVAQDGL